MVQFIPKISSLGVDPIEGAEILDLIGVNYYDFENPKKLNQIQDVVNYFSGKKDKRYQILKVLSGKTVVNRLDTIWTFVELIKERENKIAALNQDDFEPDIQEELKNKYLTRDKIKIIKKDIDNHKKQAEEIKKREMEDRQYNKLVDKKLTKAIDVSKLIEIEKNVNEIEQLNEMLMAYDK
jgi:hypothetical protein